MPEVHVYHWRYLLGREEIEEVKCLLRAECISRYSTDQIQLTGRDFRFIVERCSPPSELDYDVVIRIELHASKERLGADEQKVDRDAKELADMVRNIRPLVGPSAISVGVELVFAIIGWGAAGPFRILH